MHKISVDKDGHINETKKIDRYQYLGQFADEQLQFLKDRESELKRIEDIKKQISERASSIDERYRLIIKTMTKDEKEQLKISDLVLYQKLSRAFPNDFEKYIPTVKAGA